MKLIRCTNCSEPIALTYQWISCECGLSGGAYAPDGRRAVIAGQCQLIGIDNRVFLGQRVEAWPYDESNGKITRLAENPGRFPDRAAAGPV